jgi:membrane-bound lytic murein transglycosylase B
VRHRLTRISGTPAFGLTIIAALMVVGAVGAAPGPATLGHPGVQQAGVLPMAAVAASLSDDAAGPAIITVSRPPTSFHIAAANISAPPPTVVVNSPGALQIPAMVLNAYRNAERMMAGAAPGCGIGWNLLAGIGRIESMHANGGATDARGNAVRPILGPVLDGSLPGNEVIVQSRAPGRLTYARALGPMQFLPGTWARYASDGDGDGKADVQNVFDASLAAARYLCSGGLNLRDQQQALAAVLRYNNSMPYARNVLGWAAAYATGVVPVDLPPLTGPIPPIGDAHLEEAPEGLGPGLPINATGLPPTDPLALYPVSFGVTDAFGHLPTTQPMQDPSAMAAAMPAESPSCVLVCLGHESAPPLLPPWLQPPGTAPPGTALPGTAPPGTALPGPLPLGTALPGPLPPGTALPGAAPPGTALPGPLPPGGLLPVSTAPETLAPAGAPFAAPGAALPGASGAAVPGMAGVPNTASAGPPDAAPGVAAPMPGSPLPAPQPPTSQSPVPQLPAMHGPLPGPAN